MTRTKTTLLAILIFGCGALAGVPAKANDCSRVQQLAADIHDKTRLLNRELVRHYRQVPQYQCLRRETREVRRLAARIRGWSHNLRNLPRICEDLAKLDACFHRLEAAFDEVEFAAARGFGQIPCSTQHVKLLLRDTSACIVAMRREVRRLNRFALRGARNFNNIDRFAARPPYAGPGQINRGQFLGNHLHQNNLLDNRFPTTQRPSIHSAFQGHSNFIDRSLFESNRFDAPAVRNQRRPLIVDPTPGLQIGRGVHLDGNGLTLGRGNMNFRINF